MDSPEIDLTEEHTAPTNNEVDAPAFTDENKAEAAEIDPEPEPPAEEPKAEAGENVALPAKELAQMAVAAIESFICLTVPSWIRAEEFTPAELKRLDELTLDMVSAVDMTEVDKQLLLRNAKFTKRMERDMPLEDKTRTTYTKTWEKVIDKWNINMTPEKALITSTALIVGSRAFPVLAKKTGRGFKKLFSWFTK